MMIESARILEGFDTLCGEGKGGALATVIRVAGSSYRRPGARMLVAADGRTWGGISGGCLERDVIRRARQLVDTDATAIVRYDTTDEEDDVRHGVALGCAGVIDLFLEPISVQFQGPIAGLRRAVIDRRQTALATVVRGSGLRPGTRIAFDGSDAPVSLFSDNLYRLLQSGEGGVRQCEGMEVFFELLRPPQALVIFGSGPDVTPLVGMAKVLGWHVTVVHDEEPGSIEAEAAVVVMTHNYRRDQSLLPKLLAMPLRYLGVLGPRRRLERLVANDADALDCIYAPVGLDIGADTPETIALAIAAEIQGVLAGRPTASLRDKPGPIYPRAENEPMVESQYTPQSCPLSA